MSLLLMVASFRDQRQATHRDRVVAGIGPAGPAHLRQLAEQVAHHGRHRLGHIDHLALDAW